jgi:hypothetical protein
MAAAIFRLNRRSVFIQTLPSKEQREHEVTKLLEAGKHGLRNWIEEQTGRSASPKRVINLACHDYDDSEGRRW